MTKLSTSFPITWEHPDDANACWRLDRMHWLAPITPMTDEWLRIAYDHGLTQAAQSYGMPIRAHARRFNTYHYDSIMPSTASFAEGMMAHSEDTVAAAANRLGEDWTNVYLPEIKEHLAHWEQFDLSGATMPALLAHLDETLVRSKRLWRIHFRMFYAWSLAMSEFDDLYRGLFTDHDEFGAYRLLQGFRTQTHENDLALWQLSRKALAAPHVRRILEACSAADALAELRGAADCQPFLVDLNAYLAEHGQRGSKFNEVDEPGWIEDPSTTIQIVKDYLEQPDRDMEAELAALADERERLITAAREKLRSNNHSPEVVEHFESSLKAAQAAIVISEDHNDWIDQRGTYQMRRILLEFGRRLAAARVLDRSEDVFFLTLDELRETAELLPRMDRRRLIAGRRAEMEYFRGITPPPMLGSLPPGPPPDDPLSRAILGKFAGLMPQPASERDHVPGPITVRGNAGSPGKVRGTARVVRTLAEAHKLRRGDILVTETTSPPWTPYFAIVAAIVTDTGGILSHCAIVAREYRIPAVVGTGDATTKIRDGQQIEVDGSAGVVTILE